MGKFLKFKNITGDAWRNIATHIEGFGKHMGEVPVVFKWTPNGGVAILKAEKISDGAHPGHDGYRVGASDDEPISYGPIEFAVMKKIMSEIEAVADFVGAEGKVRETLLDADGIHIEADGLAELIELPLWDGSGTLAKLKLSVSAEPIFGNSLGMVATAAMHKRILRRHEDHSREHRLGRVDSMAAAFADMERGPKIE